MACLLVPKLKVLLLRRTFPELNDTHIERAMLEAPLLGAEYLKSEHKMRFSNGSIEQYGHVQDDAALSRYLSTEYDRIAFDELVTFTKLQFLMLGSRLRSSIPGVEPVLTAGTNPGGIGAAWVKRYFIDHDVTPEEDPAYRAEDYAYIPSVLEDNPYVDAGYELRLLALPEDLRRAYRSGDWDIFPGQYFREWRRARHVVLREYDPRYARFCALDWGYLRSGICGWFVAHSDGHLYLEEEYVFTETIASEVAKEITRRTKDRGIKVRYTAADPAMWIRDGQTGESLAETFNRAGVPLVKAHHERVNGWQRVRAWLRSAPDGRPWLEVSPACGYVARTMPALMADPTKPEDVDSDGEDHGADMLRYGMMSRPWPTREPVTSPSTTGTLAWWKSLDRAVRRPLSRRDREVTA